ncbi:MAG: tryptophan synthase subunit alpha [Candidatus Omnitrophica bacterium]|nr:tryptophan synthase subunit alpha [Candidatus Omnitrophota bacterium]
MSTQPTVHRGADAITHAFRRRNASGEKVFIPYIMAGDPDLGTTEKIVRSLSGIDVDIIELGMPFSDPMADGPVIQRASERSLRQGLTLKRLLEAVQQLRLDIDTPIVIMTYYNLFFCYGLEAFAHDAAAAGVDGVIVPDLPVEESEEFQKALDAEGIALIYLVAPTSTDERIRKIAQRARGFIYYVSRTGVTGLQKDVSSDLESNLKRLQSLVDLPIAVGFGVSTPEQAASISHLADGVIMGSAIVKLIGETDHMHEQVAAKFLSPIIQVLHNKE